MNTKEIINSSLDYVVSDDDRMPQNSKNFYDRREVVEYQNAVRWYYRFSM